MVNQRKRSIKELFYLALGRKVECCEPEEPQESHKLTKEDSNTCCKSRRSNSGCC